MSIRRWRGLGLGRGRGRWFEMGGDGDRSIDSLSSLRASADGLAVCIAGLHLECLEVCRFVQVFASQYAVALYLAVS
jgi:hypothetical protein